MEKQEKSTEEPGCLGSTEAPCYTFITELRKAAKCVFLATEEDIARDLSGKLNKAARLLETLNAHGDVLCVLINEWEAQGKFLNNPHDHPEDRAAGRTYTECAEILRNRFSV